MPSFRVDSRRLVHQALNIVHLRAHALQLLAGESRNTVKLEHIGSAAAKLPDLVYDNRATVRTVLVRQPLVFVPAARLFGTDAVEQPVRASSSRRPCPPHLERDHAPAAVPAQPKSYTGRSRLSGSGSQRIARKVGERPLCMVTRRPPEDAARQDRSAGGSRRASIHRRREGPSERVADRDCTFGSPVGCERSRRRARICGRRDVFCLSGESGERAMRQATGQMCRSTCCASGNGRDAAQHALIRPYGISIEISFRWSSYAARSCHMKNARWLRPPGVTPHSWNLSTIFPRAQQNTCGTIRFSRNSLNLKAGTFRHQAKTPPTFPTGFVLRMRTSSLCRAYSRQTREFANHALPRRPARAFEVFPRDQPGPRSRAPRLVGGAQGHRPSSAPATSAIRPGRPS